MRLPNQIGLYFMNQRHLAILAYSHLTQTSKPQGAQFKQEFPESLTLRRHILQTLSSTDASVNL